MSIANVKPEIWSTTLLQARDAKTVAVQNSWRNFDGDIKKAGDKVHVAGLSGATIKDLPTSGVIDAAEDIVDESMEIVVDQKKYINFKVNDLDAMQSHIDAKNPVMQKTGNNYAANQDKFIYSKALDGVPTGNIVSLSSASATNILAKIGYISALLKSNNADGNIMAELHPFVYQLIWQAIVANGNPNNDTLVNGFRGNLNGIDVYEAPLIPCTSDAAGATPVNPGTASAYYQCVFRTQEAIAFAEQKAIDFEPYRVELGFADGLKGYGVYGAKVTRPSELAILRIQLA